LISIIFLAAHTHAKRGQKKLRDQSNRLTHGQPRYLRQIEFTEWAKPDPDCDQKLTQK